jgi:hypothetical protein
MNTPSLENKREFVWTIHTKPLQKPQIDYIKEPVLVKALIDKTFKKLSAQLLQRMSQLEEELQKLKNENDALKQRLSMVKP